MAYTFKELDPSLLEAVSTHITDVTYPPKKFLGRKISPIVHLKDGRTVPLLLLMAKLKYGATLDLTKQQPYWIDTNWYNASPTNIGLFDIPDPRTKRAGRPPVVNVGVPSDHPDYAKRYMDLTREKQREYRRKRYVKLKNAAAIALDMKPSEPAPDDVLSTLPIAEQSDSSESMGERLNEILASQKIASTPPPTPKVDRPDLRWSTVASTPIPSSFTKDFLDGIAAAPVPSAEEVKSFGRTAPDDVFAPTKKKA